MSDGSVILEKSYIEKFNKNVDMELFEGMRENAVKEYVDNINMFVFVLRKIKFFSCGCLSEEGLV